MPQEKTHKISIELFHENNWVISDAPNHFLTTFFQRWQAGDAKCRQALSDTLEQCWPMMLRKLVARFSALKEPLTLAKSLGELESFYLWNDTKIHPNVAAFIFLYAIRTPILFDPNNENDENANVLQSLLSICVARDAIQPCFISWLLTQISNSISATVNHDHQLLRRLLFVFNMMFPDNRCPETESQIVKLLMNEFTQDAFHGKISNYCYLLSIFYDLIHHPETRQFASTEQHPAHSMFATFNAIQIAIRHHIPYLMSLSFPKTRDGQHVLSGKTALEIILYITHYMLRTGFEARQIFGTNGPQTTAESLLNIFSLSVRNLHYPTQRQLLTLRVPITHPLLNAQINPNGTMWFVLLSTLRNNLNDQHFVNHFGHRIVPESTTRLFFVVPVRARIPTPIPELLTLFALDWTVNNENCLTLLIDIVYRMFCRLQFHVNINNNNYKHLSERILFLLRDIFFKIAKNDPDFRPISYMLHNVVVHDKSENGMSTAPTTPVKQLYTLFAHHKRSDTAFNKAADAFFSVFPPNQRK